MTSSSSPVVKAGRVTLATFLYGAPIIASLIEDPIVTPGFLAGTLPIQSDCVTLSSTILAASTTYSLAAGACETPSYGTCIAGICAVCSDQDGYKSVDFSNAVSALIDSCLLLPNNEVGTAEDSGNVDEIIFILEYSGDELPAYSCPKVLEKW